MHIQGEERSQSLMFPEGLDDYVADDAQVRFLDVFVDSLDLQALDFHQYENGTPETA